MKTVAGLVVAAAFVALGVGACGSGGTHSASATGRVAGDNGKLLPTLSCWLDASPRTGGENTVISLAIPAGKKVDCDGVADGFQGTLGSNYTVSAVSSVPTNELPRPTCRGSLDGYLATAFYNGSTQTTDMDRTVDAAMACVN
jgi:hypothetical protein